MTVGEQWETTFCENYMPGRPPACPLTDPVSIRLHRKLIEEKGALLLGEPEEFADFLKENGNPKIEFRLISFQYRAKFGKRKHGCIYAAYLPPRKK